jgi:Flp pilus assembly pilin Flp
MLAEFQRFFKDESGDFIEWAVRIIILLMAVVLALTAVGGELKQTYQDIKNWIYCARTGTCQ